MSDGSLPNQYCQGVFGYLHRASVSESVESRRIVPHPVVVGVAERTSIRGWCVLDVERGYVEMWNNPFSDQARCNPQVVGAEYLSSAVFVEEMSEEELDDIVEWERLRERKRS